MLWLFLCLVWVKRVGAFLMFLLCSIITPNNVIPDMPQTPHAIDRLYLDFDSFFATAEQHFNPALRGRPVGVVPLDSPHTGCIAVSREAKARGVKSNTSIVEARKLIPDMIFVVARHDVYVRLHNKILDVLDTVLPVAHVRSIDEVVCHLLPSEAREGRGLSDRIKTALATGFSDVLTCSIGMAPTELLAKIGAEMNKPDGFTLVNTTDLPECLETLDLRDLPGISSGMEARLHAAGIVDFRSLWNIAPKQARAIWRSVEGERFWSELHGIHAQRPETKKGMFGHSRMLPVDWQNPDKVCMCAQQLTMSASKRLRRANLRAVKLSLGLRGGDRRDKTGQRSKGLRWGWDTQFLPARDDHTFLDALAKGLQQAVQEVSFRPRSVSVTLHGLADDAHITGDLFEDQPDDARGESVKERMARWETVSDMMDKLRSTHGPEVISLGAQDEIPGGYLGAKIAFGRIPDAADFGKAPVADEDTHFCTV